MINSVARFSFIFWGVGGGQLESLKQITNLKNRTIICFILISFVPGTMLYTGLVSTDTANGIFSSQSDTQLTVRHCDVISKGNCL
jgi:hypothetical protein